jgi:hypothetical protein
LVASWVNIEGVDDKLPNYDERKSTKAIADEEVSLLYGFDVFLDWFVALSKLTMRKMLS